MPEPYKIQLGSTPQLVAGWFCSSMHCIVSMRNSIRSVSKPCARAVSSSSARMCRLSKRGDSVFSIYKKGPGGVNPSLSNCIQCSSSELFFHVFQDFENPFKGNRDALLHRIPLYLSIVFALFRCVAQLSFPPLFFYMS